MLAKLSPELVSKYWNEIFPMIEAAMPVVSNIEQRRKRILSSCLSGELVCWAILDQDNQLLGLATTTFTLDNIDGERNLLLYTLFSKNGIADETWTDNYNCLRAFARGQGCQFIIGYTSMLRLVELAEMLGARTDERIIRMEVN
jgi:hypothetical protein